MPMSEEIFIKEKPKRKLTQAQLDGLAKGRAKVKAKRDAKNGKPTRQETMKEERKKKNKTIAEQREIELQRKLEKKHQEKIDRFNEIKYKYMDRCKTLSEMREMKEMLDDIEEEEVYDLHAVGKKLAEKIKLKYYNITNEREEDSEEQGEE
tara:strand:+ start:847 stop:1299 length:453 start_codon:yes stop_codon:yes gene_type:complete